MKLLTHVVATFHELTLKGGNRGFFQRALAANIETALAGLPLAEVSIPARVVIRFSRPVPWSAIHPRLATVFGLNNLIPVTWVGTTYDELEAYVAGELATITTGPFAVHCQRSYKQFPLTSMDVDRRLGAFVHERTGLPVDLSHPATELGVLVQPDGIYYYRERFAGAGGLPVGTSGRVMVLMSGGIDSPAAAFMTTKRGTRAIYVHFHSVPYTPDASIRKVEEIVRILNRHQGASRLALVPFAEFQREVVARSPDRLRVVLYRRMMMRVAERLARRWRCHALVTGEALNQVASQTLANLAVIDRVVYLPVLRPLVGMDKDEIITIAQRARTFETSILPAQDCCSFLQPAHPATHCSALECEAAEQDLDVDGWMRRLAGDAEVRHVEPLPWAE